MNYIDVFQKRFLIKRWLRVELVDKLSFLRDFINREKEWLVLLSLVFGCMVVSKWTTISRTELLIILFAVWMVGQTRRTKRQLEELEKRLEELERIRKDLSSCDFQSRPLGPIRGFFLY